MSQSLRSCDILIYMDWILANSSAVLVAILAGIGAFSIMYFAARLALKDHDEDKLRKGQRR